MVGGSNPPLIIDQTNSKYQFFVDALVQKKKDVVQNETLYLECTRNPRKRNQPRFRKYRRENMEKTKHLGKSPPKDVEKSTKEGESPVDVASKAEERVKAFGGPN
ncbi:unnamed protein product [Bathycoccus prasinos]